MATNETIEALHDLGTEFTKHAADTSLLDEERWFWLEAAQRVQRKAYEMVLKDLPVLEGPLRVRAFAAYPKQEKVTT